MSEKIPVTSPAYGVSIQILVEIPNSKGYLPATEFRPIYIPRHTAIHRIYKKPCIDLCRAYIAVNDNQKFMIEVTNESKHDLIDIKIEFDGLFAGHLPVPQRETRRFKYTRLSADEAHKFSFTKIEYSKDEKDNKLNNWFGEPGTIALKVCEAERVDLTEYQKRLQAQKLLRHGCTKGELKNVKKERFGEVKRDIMDSDGMAPTHVSSLDTSYPFPIQDKEYYVWREALILHSNYIYRSKEILQYGGIIHFGTTDEQLVQLSPTSKTNVKRMSVGGLDRILSELRIGEHKESKDERRADGGRADEGPADG